MLTKLTESLKNKKIAEVLELMRFLHKKVHKGYGSILLTDHVKSTGLPTFTTTALMEVKYLRKQGAARSTKWHWMVDEPTIKMATKVFEKMVDIEKRKGTEKTLAVPSNLKPIIDGSKTIKTVRNQLLLDLQVIKNQSSDGELRPWLGTKVPESVINSLHALGYIAKKHGGATFTWIGDEPTMDLVDILISEDVVKKDLMSPGKVISGGLAPKPRAGTNFGARPETYKKVLEFIKWLHAESKAKGWLDIPLSIEAKNRTLSTYYATVITTQYMEVDTVIGPNNKTQRRLKWNAPTPTEEMAADIVRQCQEMTRERTTPRTKDSKDSKGSQSQQPQQPEMLTTASPVTQVAPASTKTWLPRTEADETKVQFLRTLEEEIVTDNAVGAEFAAVRQIHATILQMESALESLKMSAAAIEAGLDHPKVKFWAVLRKELYG